MGAAAAARLSMGEILHPKSVAVFGASETKDKYGGRIMHSLIRHGFSGEIFAINRGRATVLGHKAYAQITDVGQPIDVAILAVPAATLRDSIEQCAKAKVGCCVVVTTGFAEAGEEGAKLQDEIVSIARAAGMRLIGPNCMGLINTNWHLALCSSVVLDTDYFPKGKIALVSQSGALMVSLFDRASKEGIGLGISVSLGNQADVEVCDVLEYLIEDKDVPAICLYVEGFRDPARFVRAAAACKKAGKPLILVKTGRTPDGVRAAQSHTASLAGSFESLVAVCRQYGVVLAEDPVAMIRIADFLVRWPHADAGAIGILSGSGGGAGLMVDRLSAAGLPLARLSDDTKGKLREFLLPPQADNPIDLGGRTVPETQEISDKAMTLLAQDPAVSLLAIYVASMPAFASRTRLMARAAVASGKPVIAVSLPGTAADRPRKAMTEEGCPHLDSVDDMLAVLKGARDYWMSRSTVVEAPKRGASIPASLPKDASSLAAFAARYGVPFAAETTCRTLDAAIAAADATGYPVVLKGMVEGVTHKSDLGLVRTGLANAEGLRAAWHEIEASAVKHAGAANFHGCVVQEQIASGLELIVSIRHDPQYGPMVMVGAGGIMVELTKDTVLAPAPVSPAEAEEMLRGLRIAPLFDGFRGKERVDVVAAAKIVAGLSWLAVDLGDRLVDLEINPLITGSGSSGAKAVDLRGEIIARG